MLPPSSLPFGTVDTGGDINYSAWPFALSEVTGVDDGAMSTGAVDTSGTWRRGLSSGLFWLTNGQYRGL